MASKEPRSKQDAPLTLASLPTIRALAKVVSQYDLSELEVELKDERIRVCRELAPSTSLPGTAPLSVPVSPPSVLSPGEGVVQEPASGEVAADDGSILITSPFVGTFYRAPSPESPPFVELGQTVNKGQVICIIEAMKLMNEIEAEMDCKIIEVLAKNADAVEFGQNLFRAFPLA